MLALALSLGAACNRTWNLTALQVFQVLFFIKKIHWLTLINLIKHICVPNNDTIFNNFKQTNLCFTQWLATQEGVAARSRGTVGGVQSCLDFTALSLHGFLAITARGKEVCTGCRINSFIILLWILTTFSARFYQSACKSLSVLFNRYWDQRYVKRL